MRVDKFMMMKVSPTVATQTCRQRCNSYQICSCTLSTNEGLRVFNDLEKGFSVSFLVGEDHGASLDSVSTQRWSAPVLQTYLSTRKRKRSHSSPTFYTYAPHFKSRLISRYSFYSILNIKNPRRAHAQRQLNPIRHYRSANVASF